jgi:hypothetical protein
VDHIYDLFWKKSPTFQIFEMNRRISHRIVFPPSQPILVAAAIDYTIHNGTTPGALARKISSDIRDQRVIEAAQQKDGHKTPALKPGMPGYRECEHLQSRYLFQTTRKCKTQGL